MPNDPIERIADLSDVVQLRPVGWVRSTLVDPSAAPRQGDEGAPDAWLVFYPELRGALGGLVAGTDVVLLTWLHRAA